MGLCLRLGVNQLYMYDLLGKVLFLLGPPVGTGCSVDKLKGTQISLHTNSVYRGSLENTGGAGSHSWHRAPSPVWWGGVWCSHACGHAHMHTHILAQLPSTLPCNYPPLGHRLITEYAHYLCTATHTCTPTAPHTLPGGHPLRHPCSLSPLPHSIYLCPQVIRAHMHPHTNGIRILEVESEVTWLPFAFHK